MSQQAQFEEQRYHPDYTASVYEMEGHKRYEDEIPDRQPYQGFGQKLLQGESLSRLALSAGQRLALAIVSVGVLIPLVAILLGNGSDESATDFFFIAGRLTALALVCVTIMIVNIAVNRRR